ncbi:MAG: hypothetical protein KDE33_11280 [Bacteroidetes bacterium]|nr:hypothetical protein [Bacteroidota bacterium]
MNSFQYALYSINAKKESSDLENAFKDLIKKVELYEKQYEVTLKLYKSEWEKELKEVDEIYAEFKEERKVIYDKAYAEMEGENEQLRDSYAEHVSGLEMVSYKHYEERENIKIRYLDFFDLYSKSLLTALYSLIENKLKEICDIVSKDFGYRIKYEHLDSRNYLNTSLNYFELVIQIPIESIEPFISKLKDIQFIRNKVIHTESKFSGDNEKTIVEIVNKSKGALELKKHGESTFLRIKKSKYILDYFELIRELFEELIWLLDSKQERQILRKGLEYWFGLLDKNIFIKNIASEKVGKGKRDLEFELSSRKKSIPKFKCKLSIVRGSKNSLEIIDQTTNKVISKFNELVNEKKSFIFNYAFEMFNLSDKGLKIKVMMF